MPCVPHWPVAVFIVTSLQFTACQQQPEPPPEAGRTRIELAGDARQRIRLTARRAAELGLATAPIGETKFGGKVRKVVPVMSVIYDSRGSTWVFSNPDSLVFVRERVKVDSLAGELAVLAEGPPVGARIVTAGAANLFNQDAEATSGGQIAGRASERGAAQAATGTLTMQPDGTLKLVHQVTSAGGLGASVVIVYQPTDEEYQKLLARVGGLQVGESKSINMALDK
ncbi:MAG: hypothetical protein DKINENOH_02780 [bacterium]|nr:hypothetical protein [bacterium]